MFGGRIALVGYLQRDLVERRRWLRQSHADEGLLDHRPVHDLIAVATYLTLWRATKVPEPAVIAAAVLGLLVAGIRG